MIAIVVYILIVNIVAFSLMGSDKTLAKKGKRRISERRLLTYAALGGSVGAYVGMRAFRHKTKHAKFFISLPLMVIAHVILFGALFRWLMAS
ncbi:uncharacterized membrane protein YsdA (DUF1294 family) [Paenibacillus phyllosphaerae]|uniref:Uncharacterized membrane protein YsdA (DUF1294 family) n=1 Tax=Paenibacillus phyllosphaerae TaxID=274593 RepID=A0A7W5FLY2_9BACL|nr:DUF1294 domain-containing protein [Paenibacillus phyllosphaerae]MBB3109497.1 uncharacterized membrane protein YsdA (DUF1294 family) [Paenibacillus phyllosphaerae]